MSSARLLNGGNEFIARAELFAARFRNAFIFRVMRWYLGCSVEQLDFVIKKIYVHSIPENSYVDWVSPIRAYIELLLLPWHCLVRKRLFWKREAAVDYNIELEDKPSFDLWISVIYRNLNGSKRLTPYSQHTFVKGEVSDDIDATVRWRDLLALFVIIPLLLGPLYFFSMCQRIPLTRAFARSLYYYAKFNGYFSRYPCRHFLTYKDETNHPCRYIAFKQNCDGYLYVIQNGERLAHPHVAYGMMDAYFVFGRSYIVSMQAVNVHARRFYPVGSICLNARFDQLELLKKTQDMSIIYDIVFIDQAVYPHNGFNAQSGAALEKIFVCLNTFIEKNPHYRVGYQLRPYGSNSHIKAIVLARLSKYIPKGIQIIENSGNGEVYTNILRSHLIMTFESTLGFEAMRMGKKVLFVNFSGNKLETLCPDSRFQLEDAEANYDRFEQKVKTLLQMELTEMPQVALDKQAAFSGTVRATIASILNETFQDLG